jgi:hypothetical protein
MRTPRDRPHYVGAQCHEGNTLVLDDHGTGAAAAEHSKLRGEPSILDMSNYSDDLPVPSFGPRLST